MRRSPSSSPAGFALLAVLLALLVLTGLLHGALAVGRFHAFASRAEGRAARARLAAQSGVRLAVAYRAGEAGLWAAPGGVSRRTVSVGPDATVGVSARWLSSEWVWVEAEARVGFGAQRGVHRTGAVYWSLDPRTRTSAVPATVEVGGTVSTGSPSSITPLESGFGDPGYEIGSCDVAGSADPFFGLPTQPSIMELPEVGGGGFIPDPASVLGLLDRDALAARVSMPVSVDGGPTLRVVDGPFTVPEEGVHGVLVVSGDLEVPAGRQLAGVALVGGSLMVGDRGLVVGSARVRGSVAVLGAGRILGSRCTVLDVLRELPALSVPMPAPGGTWIRMP